MEQKRVGQRWGFYLRLLWPRGWVSVIVTVLAVLYGPLDLWRNEAPSEYQPPKLIEDALGWAPWWLWILLLFGAALIVVMESAYNLSQTAAEAHATSVTDLKDRIAKLEATLECDDLIRATPIQVSSLRPTGQGQPAWEVLAYLDVETADRNKPLHNCRIKLLDLYHFHAFKERSGDEVQVVERWDRDTFYGGQTYAFCWSGRDSCVDAIDVHSKERASIARCLDTRAELTTTSGSAGHLFHGDQYHLFVEITADNSRPVKKEYWLRMHEGSSPVIQEWDDSRTTWL